MWIESTDPATGRTESYWACAAMRGPGDSQVYDAKWEREIHAADPEGDEWGA